MKIGRKLKEGKYEEDNTTTLGIDTKGVFSMTEGVEQKEG